jgi:hypothetical protein
VFPAVFFHTSSFFSLLSNPISTNHLPHCTLFWLSYTFGYLIFTCNFDPITLTIFVKD